MFFLFDRFFNQVLLIVRIDFDSNLSLPDLKQNPPNCYEVTNYITFAENLSTVDCCLLAFFDGYNSQLEIYELELKMKTDIQLKHS